MSDAIHILLIEDNAGESPLVQVLLEDNKTVAFTLQSAESLALGLDLLSQSKFDIILLDLSLPDSSGLETLLAVRRFKPEVAVIVLTNHEDEALGLQATQEGAQDYLVKGQVSSRLLARSIRYSMERKRFERRLEYLASHDDLTGLPNRQLFNYTLGQALERARRARHSNQQAGSVAVMLLDLDNFKQINDSHGHLRGDDLLRAVAARLQGCMRKSDTVARMGGDEFTLVIEQVGTPEDAGLIARKVLEALSRPIHLDGVQMQTSASLGISMFPGDGSNPENLLQHADIAMYQAKQTRNCYKFYTPTES